MEICLVNLSCCNLTYTTQCLTFLWDTMFGLCTCIWMSCMLVFPVAAGQSVPYLDCLRSAALCMPLSQSIVSMQHGCPTVKLLKTVKKKKDIFGLHLTNEIIDVFTLFFILNKPPKCAAGKEGSCKHYMRHCVRMWYVKKSSCAENQLALKFRAPLKVSSTKRSPLWAIREAEKIHPCSTNNYLQRVGFTIPQLVRTWTSSNELANFHRRGTRSRLPEILSKPEGKTRNYST